VFTSSTDNDSLASENLVSLETPSVVTPSEANIPLVQLPISVVTPVSNVQKDTKLKLPPFSGINDETPIDQWLTFYQRHFSHLTQEELIDGLWYNFTNDARLWFGNEMTSGNFQNLTWNEIKAVVIDRFSILATSYLDQAMSRTLKPGESVAEYYNTMIGLLSRTTIRTESDRMDFLTKGLPQQVRQRVEESRFQCKTTTDWLKLASAVQKNVASTAVSTAFRPPIRPSFKPSQLAFQKPPASTIQKSTPRTGKPPSQSRHCASNGKPNQFHWHKDCPQKPVPSVRYGVGEQHEYEVALNSESGPSSGF